VVSADFQRIVNFPAMGSQDSGWAPDKPDGCSGEVLGRISRFGDFKESDYELNSL
jgi:hypothetical protein